MKKFVSLLIFSVILCFFTFSLSGCAKNEVDKVSKNAESCWNIAPSGVTGLDATLYYLNHLSVTDGIIKCKFNV